MNELGERINEPLETQKFLTIIGALNNFVDIIERVAEDEDYSGATTVGELRAGHPEMGFMDDDEIEEILRLAKKQRASQRKEPK